MRRAQSIRGLDPLIDAGRRHANVGEHDIGLFLLHRGKQRLEITADGHDVNLGLSPEQTLYSLANEVMVVGEDNTDRHCGS
jgi:hypothetical protein